MLRKAISAMLAVAAVLFSQAAANAQCDPPQIVTQPVHLTVALGGDAVFVCSAVGHPPVTYRWMRNGIDLSNGGGISGVFTSTLTIANVEYSDSAAYSCRATDFCGVTTSASAVLTVDCSATFDTQPVDQTVCDDQDATFSVLATGIGLNYHWARLESGSSGNFGLLQDGPNISGATTATLTLLGVNNGGINDGAQFKCRVTNTCSSVDSGIATLTVGDPPAVTTPPVDQEVCPGSNATFSITATGPSLTYQWQRAPSGGTFANLANGPNIAGARTATLTLLSVNDGGTNDGAQFRCTVTSPCAALASSPATLRVDASPAITTQPVDQEVCPDSNATFSISPSGSSRTYRWQRAPSGGTFANLTDGPNITGAATATLTLLSVNDGGTNDGAQFRCSVTSACGITANSNAALLTVNITPAITTQPVDQEVCAGGDATFSISPGGSSRTYRWQRAIYGSFVDLSDGPNITGAATATLTLLGVIDGGTNDGAQFRCTVTSVCGITANSNAARLTVNITPTITTQPVNQEVCPGDTATFSIAATGSSLTYQWQSAPSGGDFADLSDGPDIAGARTATLTLLNLVDGSTSDGARFRCTVTSDCGITAFSNARRLIVNGPPAFTTQPVDQSVCAGSEVAFRITSPDTNLTYQWQRAPSGGDFADLSDGPNITGAATATLTLLNLVDGSTNDGARFRCTVTSACGFPVNSNAATLSVDDPPAITTQPVDQEVCHIDTATFSIAATGSSLTYQWQSAPSGGAFADLSNNQNVTGVASATLRLFRVSDGGTSDGALFRCIVTGCRDETVNSNAARLDVNAPPAITTQPVDQSVCAGSEVAFSITAPDTNLTFQWQRAPAGGTFANLTDGPDISGATTETLTLLSVADGGANDDARFRCAITSDCGITANSNAARLTVNITPAITTQPVDRSDCGGSNATFSIAATGPGLTYQWQRAPSGGTLADLADGPDITGATTETLTLLSVTDGGTNDGAQFRCTVTSVCGISADSNAATLTVNLQPTITTQPVDESVCVDSDAAFSIAATGAGLTFQWQRAPSGGTFADLTDGPNITGAATATLTLLSVTDGGANDGAQFRCTVTGCGITANSNAATLTVNAPPAIRTQPVNQTICGGSDVAFSIATTGTGLTYRWQRAPSGGTFADLSNGPNITGAASATLTLLSVTDGGTNDGAQFRCTVTGCGITANSNAATLTVNLQPTITTQPLDQTICAASSATFSIAASSVQTYQWQRAPAGGTFADLANGSNIAGARTATLTLLSVSNGGTNDGAQFRCRVSSDGCGFTNSSVATLTVNASTPPSITTPPVDQGVCAGGDATFSIAATGPGLTFQWQRAPSGGSFADLADGPDITGSATETLTLLSVTDGGTNDGAQFRCRVSSAGCGLTDSSVATLTLISPPVITAQPQNARTCPSAPAVFTISTLEGQTPTFRWQWLPAGAAAWSDLVNGANSYTGTPRVSASGVDTPVLSLTPMAGPASAAQVRCIVSASSCQTQSASAALTVCMADYNCSGTVSVQDIFDFLAGYFSGAPAADINNSGAITVQDIFDFLAAYFAGCA